MVSTSSVTKKQMRDLVRTGPKYRESVSFLLYQNFKIIMDACEKYAKRLDKKEDVEVDALSEWVKSIANILKRMIRRLKQSVITRDESIFCDPGVFRELDHYIQSYRFFCISAGKPQICPHLLWIQMTTNSICHIFIGFQ